MNAEEYQDKVYSDATLFMAEYFASTLKNVFSEQGLDDESEVKKLFGCGSAHLYHAIAFFAIGSGKSPPTGDNENFDSMPTIKEVMKTIAEELKKLPSSTERYENEQKTGS